MKTYNIAELKKIAKEQGYKRAALEGADSTRHLSFNAMTVKVDKQLDNIFTRLKSDVLPEGVYNVLMAHSIAKSNTPDRFVITKGKVSPEVVQAAAAQPQIIIKEVEKATSVLTWEKALEMQNTISKLTAENETLKFQNNELQKQIEELEAEADESEGGGLSEGAQGLASILKEQAPVLTALAERYFDLEEKKINLRAQQKPSTPPQGGKRFKRADSQMEIGSKQHLDYIEKLFNEDSELLDSELDKLEAYNYQLYKEVMDKLGLTE